jgi:hypothetical protein
MCTIEEIAVKSMQAAPCGQDSLVDKALDYSLKGTEFDPCLDHKGAKHERLIVVSPCEIIKIC